MSFTKRRDRVRENLSEEALLVTTPENVRYLSGFTGSNGQLLLTKESIFFTDGRYTEQSAAQVTDLERLIYSGGTKLSDLVGKLLADRGITRLGIEAANVTLQTMQRLREGLSGIELVETTGVVEKVRACKDAEEVAEIKRAQEITERAVVEALKNWTSGT